MRAVTTLDFSRPGTIIPIEIQGGQAANVIAFSRGSGDSRAIVATPRRWSTLLADPRSEGTSESISSQAPYAADAHSQIGCGRESAESASSAILGIDWLDTRFFRRANHKFLVGTTFSPARPTRRHATDPTLSLACALLFADFPIALLQNRLFDTHSRTNCHDFHVKLGVTRIGRHHARHLNWPSFLVFLKTSNCRVDIFYREVSD